MIKTNKINSINTIKNSKDAGYAAILTVILLGFILLLLVTTFSLLTFIGNSGTNQSSIKETSYYLALSCIDRALLKIALDPTYIGSEVIIIHEDKTCKIEEIDFSVANSFIFRTNASSTNSKTSLELKTNLDLEIDYFKEL